LIFGLRYRAFIPRNGLHPALQVQAPVPLTLQHAGTGETHRIHLHEWKPQAGGYEGLPGAWEESQRRRSERVQIIGTQWEPPLELLAPPPVALTPYCLDLRACPGLDGARVR
jgi:uncharacterized protein (DUF2126 family)